MGRLYEARQTIDRVIAERGLDPYKIRGAISLEVGTVIGFITEDTPDDAELLAELEVAVRRILDIKL